MEHTVTVFRSADSTARDDAAAVQELLSDEGILSTAGESS
jgi:hypothetical protein